MDEPQHLKALRDRIYEIYTQYTEARKNYEAARLAHERKVMEEAAEQDTPARREARKAIAMLCETIWRTHGMPSGSNLDAIEDQIVLAIERFAEGQKANVASASQRRQDDGQPQIWRDAAGDLVLRGSKNSPPLYEGSK